MDKRRSIPPLRLKESLETTLEELAESPTLQALLYPVPGPLRDWLVGRGQVIARKRLEEFLLRLREQVEELQEQGVTEDRIERFFNSEEGFDLFRRCLAGSQETANSDRRDYYARILGGAVLDAEQRQYSPEHYLNLLSSLSDLELKAAGTLHGLQGDRRREETDGSEELSAYDSLRAEVSRELEVGEDELDLIFARLASAGLLERHSPPLRPSGGVGRERVVYRTSYMLGKLMKFLGISSRDAG